MGLLSPATVADQTGITKGTLAKWRCDGLGPQFIKVGRRIMYHPHDIQKWIDARRVSSTSQEVA